MNLKLYFVGLLVLGLTTSQAFAASGKIVGQIGLADGEVFVDGKAIQKNAPVREGSVVEVKQGHATLLVGKGSVFNLAPNSKMVVTEYQAKTDSTPEGASLDLKFGRTRALILTEGKEKKNIQIKARAATMGVRGTEIFIDAPKDPGKPLQFFTLEGKADVTAHPGAPTVALAQNQGVTASGFAPKGNSNNVAAASDTAATPKKGSDKISAPVISSAAAGSVESSTAIAATTIKDLKAEIKNDGLELSASQVPALAVATASNVPGSLSNSIAIGSLPPIQYDPIQDKVLGAAVLRPKFCNAATGVCN